MNTTITKEKLEQYFSITRKALVQAENNLDEKSKEQALDFLDMAQGYFDDAQFFFRRKKDYVLAFAAVNYAHGWLDAGARIGLFRVKDWKLFAVDEESTNYPQNTK